jgi:hypothetical protein
MHAPTYAKGTQPLNQIPNYYGRPALKPSVYGWMVALYIFIGGLSAGLQILVTAAELTAAPDVYTVSIWGRGIALIGAFLGGILLIVDLHTKRRFYNMLRIFRATSPMSIGTYALMGFGFWSLCAFFIQLFWVGWPATLCGVLASIVGWVMTTYTASLLAATATPLWAAAPRLLAVRFASSAMATGAAAACIIASFLASDSAMVRIFGNISGVALCVELIAALLAIAIYRSKGVSSTLREPRYIMLDWVGARLIGIVSPLVLYLINDFSDLHTVLLACLASICVLAGGLLMRGGVLLTGNESARRPIDYFRFAQSESQR